MTNIEFYVKTIVGLFLCAKKLYKTVLSAENDLQKPVATGKGIVAFPFVNRHFTVLRICRARNLRVSPDLAIATKKHYEEEH